MNTQAIAPSNNPVSPEERLEALRKELVRLGLFGFIIPRADEYQGEYIPPAAARLGWLTGFTGSAGASVVLIDRAAVFVDGRYTLQAQAEVDADLYENRHLVEQPPHEWLASHIQKGMRIGYDPWLHTVDQVQTLRAAVEPVGASMVAVKKNPVDAVWPGRPAPPQSPAQPHEIRYSGRSSESKRRAVADDLRKQRLDAAVLTAPDSIAWLLNVRGNDVEQTPVTLSYAIISADASVDWFIDPAKLSGGLRAHVGPEVRFLNPTGLMAAVDSLKDRRVRFDLSASPAAIHTRLLSAGAIVVPGIDPCQLPKACKNDVELQGSRASHRRDGAALIRFLAWLDGVAESGQIGEIEAADRLEAFRRENPEFRDLSFTTISGAGPNGAIVHYRVTPATERKITPGELYLVDSGAQYPDGTTDVTRTVAVGTPPPEAAEHFTLVLKGHIALALARFPAGTGGIQLDALARLPLWQRGLDYDHGTGHGVGSYLAVHEGPQRIAKLHNSVPLCPGMIVSNEPGYYRTGHYGIRIENLVAVVPVDGMLGFETLTMAPIDRRLIVRDMLTDTERRWVDDYHATVRDTLTRRLDEATAAWLKSATAPL